MCSVLYCEYCKRYIDTDYEAEHFDSPDEYECIEEEADNN